MTSRDLRFQATESSGEVSGIYLRPRGATCLFVFGHGAGAGMHHPFMVTVSGFLAQRKVATLRYQFPYMEAGKKAPSPRPVLQKTVRSAVAEGARLARGLPVFAGGKSMGGRMTSLAHSLDPLPNVRGLVFWGFPLHAPGKPGPERGEHLLEVKLPMLFLQGSRDKLANLDLLKPLCARVKPKPEMHVIDEGDHSFNVPKRTGRTGEEVLSELCDAAAGWMERWSK